MNLNLILKYKYLLIYIFNIKKSLCYIFYYINGKKKKKKKILKLIYNFKKLKKKYL